MSEDQDNTARGGVKRRHMVAGAALGIEMRDPL